MDGKMILKREERKRCTSQILCLNWNNREPEIHKGREIVLNEKGRKNHIQKPPPPILLWVKLHAVHFQMFLPSSDIKSCHTSQKYITTLVFCIQILVFQRMQFFGIVFTTRKVKACCIWIICCSYLSWETTFSVFKSTLIRCLYKTI